MKLYVVLPMFLLPFVVNAHDASKHKGKPTTGEIVSIAADKIELKTGSGTQTVTTTDKTIYEHGDRKAARGELKKGDHVTVFGTKLATGELVAREIIAGAGKAKH